MGSYMIYGITALLCKGSKRNPAIHGKIAAHAMAFCTFHKM
jgi:hypothetical protein